MKRNVQKSNYFPLATLIFSLGIICQGETVFGQKLKVQVNVIGKGKPAFTTYRQNSYYSEAIVTNLSDTAVVCYVMTCSWPTYNWISDNDSVHVLGVGCDSNFPEPIKLKAQESIRFNFLLLTNYDTIFSKRNIKLGFIYFKTSTDQSKFILNKIQIKDLHIYWSNEFKLSDNLFKYFKQ